MLIGVFASVHVPYYCTILRAGIMPDAAPPHLPSLTCVSQRIADRPKERASSHTSAWIDITLSSLHEVSPETTEGTSSVVALALPSVRSTSFMIIS